MSKRLYPRLLRRAMALLHWPPEKSLMYVAFLDMYATLPASQYEKLKTMKRTTIFADDALLNQVKQASARQNKSVAQFIREALQSHVAQQRSAENRFAFIGKYKSGRPDIAEKHEELLWSEKK
ncbi:MAG: ribbon-helix-helix protein, CopG family [Betaproteobacteria bacterium]|nr:ribbon-helix-helix protein, CopG family [Betaproteobacteria bacterium]